MKLRIFSWNSKFQKGSPLAKFRPGNAGMDLPSNEAVTIEPWSRGFVSTGIMLELPEDHYGRIAPRSGLAVHHGIHVLAGVIDPNYRGEVVVLLQNLSGNEFRIEPGDRIAQLVVTPFAAPDIKFVNKAGDLAASERGADGLGSSGVATT